MAKYIVDYYETYSKSYEVEANSKEEAEEIVENDIFEGRRQAPYNCTNSWFETNEMNEFSYLVDGVTSCCGYDFGTDMDKVKFCPICGTEIKNKIIIGNQDFIRRFDMKIKVYNEDGIVKITKLSH